MPINLQEILATIQAPVVKTAEDASAVAPAPAVEAAAAPVVPAVDAAAPVVAEASQEAEQQKVAEEMDAAGRIMARAFFDEFQKIAVSAHGYVETAADHTDAIPGVSVSVAPERLVDAMKVTEILTSLTAGERLHGSDGYIQVNGQAVAPVQSSVAAEEHPLVADAQKTANAKVIEILYNTYFQE